MASIESLGIGSGLLTSDLVDQIIAAEREPTELRLDRKEAEVEAKITAYGEVRSALDKVQSAASSLASGNLIRGTTASSSDESALTATTNSTAEPGNYRVAVDQVASAHTLATKAYTSVSDTVGTGTLTFKFGTTGYDEATGDYTGFEQNAEQPSFSIDVDSSNNTLSGLRDSINKDVEGVTASIVYDGVGYRLLLSSDETGEESSMEITASGDAGLQSLAYNAAQNDPDSNMRETQRGENALLRVNGLDITSASNQVDEVIRGVTLNLNQETTGTINLNVNRNTGEVADKMEAFVEAFNEFKFVYDEVNKFDPDEGTGGLLLGDSTLRSTYSQMRSGLNAIVENLTGADFRSLADVGLETDQTQNFQFQFDRTKFEAALNANADALSGLLARQQTATDSQIRYIAQGEDTKPGNYDVVIEKAAEQAVWEGLSAAGLDFASDVVIGGSNDEFALQLNGTQRTVSLEQGSYSNGDDLALMLQSSINSAFVGTGQSASVQFDADNQSFSITSSKFGSASTVNISSADPTLANTLGLTPSGTGQVAGQYFSGLSDAGFAATTSPGTQAVDEDSGINFESNSVSFDLELTGVAGAPAGPVNITLDEDWSSVLDTDGNVATERTREDALAYIQSELNAAGFAGMVQAEFNSADRLVFRTEPEAGTQELTVSNINTTGVDVLGLQSGTGTSGFTLSDAADFSLSYSNRYGDVSSGVVSVAAGTYETPDDLAAAIQSQINADPAIAGGAQGAMTTKGSRVLGANVDFDSKPSEIQLNLNGTDYSLRVDATSGASTLDSINAAIAATPGLAGNIEATLDSNGLVLNTTATGSGQTLEITKDGLGATTQAGTADLRTGVDFSADPTSFSLTVDGIDIDVNVNGDGTTGTNDGESNLAVIQQALDTALAAAGGGGEFQAGDVEAKLDENGQLYFETLSKMGEPTLMTYGASAAISVSNTTGTSLGISDGAGNAGADGFGMAKGLYQGFDSQATVSYSQNDSGNGRFAISFGNDTQVQFDSVDLEAAAQLGFSTGTGDAGEPARGQDVKGTINGVEATGSGQLLTARDGNSGATNGYLLGGTGADFSSAVTIDNSNNNLKVVIDGESSGTITLNSGVYTTGNALADELKRAINADAALQADGKAVDVQYDPETSTFGIFSVEKGAQSSVRVSEIDAGAIDVFGFTTSTQGVAGKDATGEKDPAAGLILRVAGAGTGERGSVSLVEGIFAKLDKTLDSFLKSEGLITNREKALERDMEGITEDRERLDARLEAQEKRLKAKFLFNDQIVNQLKSTEDFLTQQFEAMAAGRE